MTKLLKVYDNHDIEDGEFYTSVIFIPYLREIQIEQYEKSSQEDFSVVAIKLEEFVKIHDNLRQLGLI